MNCSTCGPGVCICPPPRLMDRPMDLTASEIREMTEWLPPEQPATTTARGNTADENLAQWYPRLGRPAASEIQVGGSHYRDFAIQPAEFIHKNAIGFLAGNVIKYVCRHGKKNGVEDLKKARHYIDLLIEHEYGNT